MATVRKQYALVILAKIHQNLLKDEYRSGAAQNSQGLPSKQAEGTSSQGMAEKRLQNALCTNKLNTTVL